MTFAKWLDPLGATNLLASIRKNPLHNWYESKRLHEVADVKRIIIMGDWIIFSFPPLASTQMVNAHEPDSFDKLGECLSA